MVVLCNYKKPALSKCAIEVVSEKLSNKLPEGVTLQSIDTELCFYIDTKRNLEVEDQKMIEWVISTPFEELQTTKQSKLLVGDEKKQLLIEIGPRLNFSTAFSTNAVSICQSIGLKNVTRIECTTRYLITFTQPNGVSLVSCDGIVNALHDRMTQCRYLQPISSFDLHIQREAVYEVDIMTNGKAALEKANKHLGLAFDDWDLEFYTTLFRDKIKRNPTSVECFDLAQSNSEHSRHWFFKGKMVVEGKEMPDSLFKMVMETQCHSNSNNIIKFHDNSSAIAGFETKLLYPSKCGKPSPMRPIDGITRHIILTAETHNFPTGVAPFPGATTGTGGRIRDVQATGIGAHVVAGTAGYCFGNLHIPGYELPWEDKTLSYPTNFAPPLEIAIEASNGASDYGNKFGEPVLAGFSRSFGMLTGNKERREWIKPIMFSAGMGSMDHIHSKKEEAEPGMEVVKIGGPVYRIGVGGGAASSIEVQGDNTSELDFGAVQRGDAEMEQKLNRVIRACIEMGKENPICSIHDQGAGGNGNVLKEIVEPAGALIRAKDFTLADPTISVLELWGAEYQESDAALIRPKDVETLKLIGQREKCPIDFVGTVTGDGKVKLENLDDSGAMNGHTNGDGPPEKRIKTHIDFPVDLDLENVMGSMPRKTFNLSRTKPTLKSLSFPDDLTVKTALDRVLRLPSVASKRYLTNKVDRSVTGLVAQQQCVGPFHTPLADVAVTALSHFDTVGSATSIGEQPIKGLIDPGCGARMAVGEALTNLVFARVTDLKDVKCSGNWMWPAKLPGEGAALFDACQAMCDVMKELGIAIDGGKDSLSMAARVEGETVKAPGALVISAYVGCPDITATLTPDLKSEQSDLLWVSLAPGKSRLGGSALAQCYSQLGDESPDLDKPELLSAAFSVTQGLIKDKMLLSGHDISDGGLVTCVLEMAFAGNFGINLTLSQSDMIKTLFAEELGLVLEVSLDNTTAVLERYQGRNVPCHHIGTTAGVGPEAQIKISVGSNVVLDEKMVALRDIWEETSCQLEHLQSNPHTAQQEEEGLKQRVAPPYSLTFDPAVKVIPSVQPSVRPKVAVVREEGSNGDREMIAALHMAGFEAWDINMQDLSEGAITLETFRGVVFVGGFSYADVFGSAKGWGATLLFNKKVQAQFAAFYERSDTFSLGVCNGCQLMALLGWVAPDDSLIQNKENQEGATTGQGVFVTHNKSERFESRFSTVNIGETPSIMLSGMQGSTLGIWVAHGEGQMEFRNEEILTQVKENNLIALKYVDDEGKPTEQYPLNPNGSIDGIAGLCSGNGRHLAMMPHPERCVLPWQWPWMPNDWKNMKVSPWLRMFENAYKWCIEH
ncbi:unnamed protein product [Owenia fusiformis]|uniref:Phosphoribosylformylglycinamidine synthase n=1 Tax=Owenia fusiformis TaxID=6347 RepID=A0A8J1UMN0_OWEFU|nr:unnamed protein product [Owenia fusiformis]